MRISVAVFIVLNVFVFVRNPEMAKKKLMTTIRSTFHFQYNILR